MLKKTFAYELSICDNCEKFIIYKLEQGIPNTCPKCGVPSNKTLTHEEREMLRKQQERAQFINNHGNNPHVFMRRM
jgi:hypothetical protein